jgi:DNA-binding CsgD family transcriptional regulator/PAS domain-containing protein
MDAKNTAFTSALAAIYKAAIDPASWPDALQKIADCTGDFGCVLIYGRDDGGFGVIESPSLIGTIAEYVEQGWSFRDTRAIRSRERGYFLGRDVITDRDVLLKSEYDTDPFYAEFLAPHGLKFFAAAMVSPNPKVEVAISVQRTPDRPEYSDEELEIVGILGAHVEQSLRLASKLMNSELINQGLGAALSQMGIGVFVLDSLGRIIFSNPAAEQLLGDGIVVVNGRLSLRSQVINREYQSLVRQLTGPGGGIGPARPRPILIERAGSQMPLALYAFPMTPSTDQKESFLTEGRAIVLLIDSDGTEPDPTLIRDVMGLTLGEARVAVLVGGGISPRAAAERLGIAEDTVRSVLKRVFAKAGVSRQGELVAMMTRLLLR